MIGVYRRLALSEDAVLPGVGPDAVEGDLESVEGFPEEFKLLEEGDDLDLVDGPFRLLVQLGDQLIDIDELSPDQILKQLRFLSGRVREALDGLHTEFLHHSSSSVGGVVGASEPTEEEQA